MKLTKLLSSFLILACISIPKISLAQVNSAVNNSSQTVTREVLASGIPAEIDGKILELVRYTIPPFTNLSPHIHPGIQIGRIELGILTYTVVEGTAQIKRGDASEELLQAGETTFLYAGDAVVEPAGMVHYGKNETPSPVILLSTSLFEADQPKAIIIDP